MNKYHSPKIYNKSSEQMTEIENDTVHLVITSPPYNAGIDYEGYNDTQVWSAYIKMISQVFSECFRVLVPGGRIAINCANLGRNPYFPLRSLLEACLLKSDFDLMGEIIWEKTWGTDSHAWGSYKKPTRPAIRDVHEYILLASKGRNPITNDCEGEITLEKNEFAKSTLSIWKLNPSKDRNGKHPAPFPEAIPRRLIRLFTFTNQIVLDPFAGSGTTLKVAGESKRRSIGYEISKSYYDKFLMRLLKSGIQSNLSDYYINLFENTKEPVYNK
ncbi:MAG: site-specific DNA-methyltransferase [Cocleimonas sp.]